jgi:hypothetical protein
MSIMVRFFAALIFLIHSVEAYIPHPMNNDCELAFYWNRLIQEGVVEVVAPDDEVSQLEHSGILKQADQFVYVDVDDEFIYRLIQFAPEGFIEAPYFSDVDSVGAHITAIYPDEQVGVVEECGKKVFFTPMEPIIVKPPAMPGVAEVYMVAVDAPELDVIRARYGLPKRRYDYHITVGVKPI